MQLDNLVDFEKCCKTRIFLQKSVPIQPKTSNILPKFCRSAVVSPTGALAADLDVAGPTLPLGWGDGALLGQRGDWRGLYDRDPGLASSGAERFSQFRG